jgi:hypothetical protein
MADLFHHLVHHTQANVFGGEDLFDGSGHQIGHTEPSVLGGHDLVDTAGMKVAHTVPNMLGGHDLIDGSGAKLLGTYAVPGGEEVLDGHGHVLGHMSSFGEGIAFHDLSGHYASWHQNLLGGYTADPLTNMSSIEFPSLL